MAVKVHSRDCCLVMVGWPAGWVAKMGCQRGWQPKKAGCSEPVWGWGCCLGTAADLVAAAEVCQRPGCPRAMSSVRQVRATGMGWKLGCLRGLMLVAPGSGWGWDWG